MRTEFTGEIEMANILHPSETIMRELIKEAWDDEKGIVAASYRPTR